MVIWCFQAFAFINQIADFLHLLAEDAFVVVCEARWIVWARRITFAILCGVHGF